MKSTANRGSSEAKAIDGAANRRPARKKRRSMDGSIGSCGEGFDRPGEIEVGPGSRAWMGSTHFTTPPTGRSSGPEGVRGDPAETSRGTPEPPAGAEGRIAWPSALPYPGSALPT